MNSSESISNDSCVSFTDSLWNIRAGTTYLNHGSFGISPKPVRDSRREWIEKLDQQPMDFFVRLLEPALQDARDRLAQFVGTTSDNLVFADNATYAMNVVANSFSLSAGDQVLINNHEYGAVHRIWERRARQTGAEVVTMHIPTRVDSKDEIVDAFVSQFCDQTKLLVLSHITSATAIILPVKEIAQAARQRGIAVCIDGPHAIAQIDLELDELDIDFYTASCHKWLCATLGTGFLYVHPRQQSSIEPPIKSWGRLLPAIPDRWDEEFTWIGTRDPSPFLSIPVAIDFMESYGIPKFREECHQLARQTRVRLESLTGNQAIVPDSMDWYICMTEVPLPSELDHADLQRKLWEEHQIEVPVIFFENEWFMRVSHHLYTTSSHIDFLMKSLAKIWNRSE